MIFVTLGTQDFSFHRLLLELDTIIETQHIDEEIIVQAGYTKYVSKYMKICGYMDMDEFQQYLQKSRIVVAHGGVGSILSALQLNKKVIAVARLSAFKEHENDHQVEIVSRFDELGYCIGCLEVSQVADAFKRLDNFQPKPYTSNNEAFCTLIKDKIAQNR